MSRSIIFFATGFQPGVGFGTKIVFFSRLKKVSVRDRNFPSSCRIFTMNFFLFAFISIFLTARTAKLKYFLVQCLCFKRRDVIRQTVGPIGPPYYSFAFPTPSAMKMRGLAIAILALSSVYVIGLIILTIIECPRCKRKEEVSGPSLFEAVILKLRGQKCRSCGGIGYIRYDFVFRTKTSGRWRTYQL